MEGTLLYKTEAQQRMQQDQFRLTANFRLQHNDESLVIDDNTRIKQNNSTFELKVDNNRTIYFDARAETSKWVRGIKCLMSIQRVLQTTPSEHLYVPLDDTFQKIVALPGNNLCGDCGKSYPDVACLTYGVMLCEECGAVHASMGTRMQRFKVPNVQNAKCMVFVEHVMSAVGGNANTSDRTNQILAQNASRLDRARYINAKYKQSTNPMFETLPGDLNTAIASTINSNKRQQFNPNAQHRLTSATNLHLHVRENNMDVIALLMFIGADPMIGDEAGLSAMELSIQLDHLEAAEVIAREWQLRHATSNTIL